jgi:hypothetical protein
MARGIYKILSLFIHRLRFLIHASSLSLKVKHVPVNDAIRLSEPVTARRVRYGVGVM